MGNIPLGVQIRSTICDHKIDIYLHMMHDYNLYLINGLMQYVYSYDTKCVSIALVPSDADKDILQPIGICILTHKDVMSGYNIGVYVHPAWRSEGIGAALVKKVMHRCPKTSIYPLWSGFYRKVIPLYKQTLGADRYV